jgi:hypothetical protein
MMRRSVVLGVAWLGLWLWAPRVRAGGLEVGVGLADITPPRGYRMAGYFSERFNTGTRDPLQARAIVFRQGDVAAALVFCDLVEVPRAIATTAREAASRQTGIPKENICVAATHSHTGPLYHGVLREVFRARAIAARGSDPDDKAEYPARLAEGVAQAVAAAKASLMPARLEVGTATENRLSFNRRFHMKDGSVRFNPGPLNPNIVRAAGPIDPEVGIVLVRPEAGGPPTAGLTVFALHLDTVGGTEYSADYPYFLEQELRGTFGPKFVSLFGTGTCGDINHIDVTRRERAKTEPIGRTLGKTVAAAAESLRPVKEPSLAVARAEIDVPLQRYGAEETEKARELVKAFDPAKNPFLDIVHAVKLVDLADHYQGPTERLEVQAFRLGNDVAIVALPGEVFVEHGLAIKRASPFKTTLVVELANADPAYVPTRKAFGEGSYEIVNSRVAPGGGEQLVETALRLLKGLGSAGR